MFRWGNVSNLLLYYFRVGEEWECKWLLYLKPKHVFENFSEEQLPGSPMVSDLVRKKFWPNSAVPANHMTFKERLNIKFIIVVSLIWNISFSNWSESNYEAEKSTLSYFTIHIRTWNINAQPKSYYHPKHLVMQNLSPKYYKIKVFNNENAAIIFH